MNPYKTNESQDESSIVFNRISQPGTKNVI
jgi:hypothetical protein